MRRLTVAALVWCFGVVKANVCSWPVTNDAQGNPLPEGKGNNLNLAELRAGDAKPPSCWRGDGTAAECRDALYQHMANEQRLRCDSTSAFDPGANVDIRPKIPTVPNVQTTLECNPSGSTFFLKPECLDSYQSCQAYTQAEMDALNIELVGAVCNFDMPACMSDPSYPSTVSSGSVNTSDPIACAMDPLYFTSVCYVRCKSGFACRDPEVCQHPITIAGSATSAPTDSRHTGMGLACTCDHNCWNSTRRPTWTRGEPVCQPETDTETLTRTLPSETETLTDTQSDSITETLPTTTPDRAERADEIHTRVTCSKNYNDSLGGGYMTGRAVECFTTIRDEFGDIVQDTTVNVSVWAVVGPVVSGPSFMTPRLATKNGAVFGVVLPMLPEEGSITIVAKVFSVLWTGPEFVKTRTISVELGPGTELEILCERRALNDNGAMISNEEFPFTLDQADEVTDRLVAQGKRTLADSFNATDLGAWLYVGEWIHCSVRPTINGGGCTRDDKCRLAPAFDVVVGRGAEGEMGVGWQVSPIGRLLDVPGESIVYNFTIRSDRPLERLLNVSVAPRSVVTAPAAIGEEDVPWIGDGVLTFAFTYGSPRPIPGSEDNPGGSVYCATDLAQMRACDTGPNMLHCVVRLFDSDGRPVLPSLEKLPGGRLPFGVTVTNFTTAPYLGCQNSFLAVVAAEYKFGDWGGIQTWRTELTLRASAWGKGIMSFQYHYRSAFLTDDRVPLELQFLDKGVGLHTNTVGARLPFSVAATPSVKSGFSCTRPNPGQLVDGNLWLVPGDDVRSTATCIFYPLDAYGVRVPVWPSDFMPVASIPDAVVLGTPTRADAFHVAKQDEITQNGTSAMAALTLDTDPTFAVAITVAAPVRWPVDRDTERLEITGKLAHGYQPEEIILRDPFGILPARIDTDLFIGEKSSVAVGVFKEPHLTAECNGFNVSSVQPYLFPSAPPTTTPSAATGAPSLPPSVAPTWVPTAPSGTPTRAPTAQPTARPMRPTKHPTTSDITMPPTLSPSTSLPSMAPTTPPTTGTPSVSPTSPTVPPTIPPTFNPSVPPSFSPSLSPTTRTPTKNPTNSPTMKPTASPTLSPIGIPTASPTTSMPTDAPSATPTKPPSPAPTVTPTVSPSVSPSTSVPTTNPTYAPSVPPSVFPTLNPSWPGNTSYPSTAPTTSAPSTTPTANPSTTPSVTPTSSPTGPPMVRVALTDSLLCRVSVWGTGTNLPSFWESDMSWTWSIPQGDKGDGVFHLTREQVKGQIEFYGGVLPLSVQLNWGPGVNNTWPTIMHLPFAVNYNTFETTGETKIHPLNVDLRASQGRANTTIVCDGFSDSDRPLTFAVARIDPITGMPTFLTDVSESNKFFVSPQNPTSGVVTQQLACVAWDRYGIESIAPAVSSRVTPWEAPYEIEDDDTQRSQELYAFEMLTELTGARGVLPVSHLVQAAANAERLRMVSPVTLNRLTRGIASRLLTALKLKNKVRPLDSAAFAHVAEILARTTATTIAHEDRNKAHAEIGSVVGALPFITGLSVNASRSLLRAVTSMLGTLSPFGERSAAPQAIGSSDGPKLALDLSRAVCAAGVGISTGLLPGDCRGVREGSVNLTVCVGRAARGLSIKVDDETAFRVSQLTSYGVRVDQGNFITVVGSRFGETPVGFERRSNSIVGPVLGICAVREGELLPIGRRSRVSVDAPVFQREGWNVAEANPQLWSYNAEEAEWVTDECVPSVRRTKLNVPGLYEVRENGTRNWYPVTLTAEYRNGTLRGELTDGEDIMQITTNWMRVRLIAPNSTVWDCPLIVESPQPGLVAVASSSASRRCNARDIEGCVETNSGMADDSAQCLCLRCGHGYLNEPIDGGCRLKELARCGGTERVFSADQCAGHSKFDPLWGRCSCGEGEVCFGDPGVCTLVKRCDETAAEVECLAAASMGGPALDHNPNIEKCECHQEKRGSAQWCDRSIELHVCRPKLGCELESSSASDPTLLAKDRSQLIFERAVEQVYSNYTYSFVTEPGACGYGSVLNVTSGKCVCDYTSICEPINGSVHHQCVQRGRCGEHPLRNLSSMCRLDLDFLPTEKGIQYGGSTLVRVVVTETSANPINPVQQTGDSFAADLLSLVFSWGGLNATALNATGVNTTRKSLRDSLAPLEPKGPWLIRNASSRMEFSPTGSSDTIAAAVAIFLSTEYGTTEPKIVSFVDDLAEALDVTRTADESGRGKLCIGHVDANIRCKFQITQVNVYSIDELLDGMCECRQGYQCAGGECTCPVCLNGGVCEYDVVNAPDDHNCTCPEGWEGVDCSQREERQYRFVHYRYPSANYTTYAALSASDQTKFAESSMSAFRGLSQQNGISEGGDTSDYTLLTAAASQGSIVVSFTLNTFGSTYTRRVNTSMGTNSSAQALGTALSSLGLSLGDFRGGGVDSTLPTAFNCSVIAGCKSPLSDCTCQTCDTGLMPNPETNATTCVSSAICTIGDCSEHGVPSGYQQLTPRPNVNATGSGCLCACAVNYSTTPGRTTLPFCDVDHCLDAQNWTTPGCGPLRCSRRFDGRTTAGSQPGECIDTSSTTVAGATVFLALVALIIILLLVILFMVYFTHLKSSIQAERSREKAKKRRIKDRSPAMLEKNKNAGWYKEEEGDEHQHMEEV
eukprot:Hpha_TRINITY_DN16462_c5_g5::TRINITY_DN16462_c5_g5_i1::g.161930::m.161930